MDKLFKVHIDRQEYIEKPEGYEIGLISKRITRTKSLMYARELAEDIGMLGKSVLLGVMKEGLDRKKTNFESQQVIMLDIDNTVVSELESGLKKIIKSPKGSYVSIDEILKDKFIQDNASFLYKTFSNKPTHEKYRIVFILDKEVTESYIIEELYSKLIAKYPFVDSSCKDTTRIFFGGSEFIEINFNNELRIKDVISENSLKELEQRNSIISNSNNNLNTALKSATTSGTVSQALIAIKPNLTESNKPTYQLILEGEDDEVRSRLKPYGEYLNQFEIDSVESAYMFLTKLNMGDILGLPTMKPFEDIFHEESNPSAGITQLHNGTYIYKCFSDSAKFSGGDLALVIANLLKLKLESRKGFQNTQVPPRNGLKFNAVHYLIDILGLVIIESDELKDLKKSIDFAITEFHSPSLEYNYKETYKIVKNHILEITELLRIFKENVTIDLTTNQPRLLSWVGNRTLASSIYNTSKVDTKRRKINNVANLLTLLGILFKLNYDDIPTDIKIIIDRIKQKNNHKRYLSVYEVKLIDCDFMENVNNICEKLVDYNFTVSQNMNRTSVLNILGTDVANRVYPQDKNLLVNNKLENLKIPFFTELNSLLDIYEYVPEKYIKALIKTKYPELKFNESGYQNIKIIFNDYGITKIRLTKELKDNQKALDFYSLSKSSFPSVLIRL